MSPLDTGIDTQHPDLNVVGGTDCARGGGGIDDLNGHGTAVAGFIGARDNAIGRAGVAPGARLWSVRVLGKKAAGTDSQIICGIDWVTATRTDADPTNDIAVANMSLLGPGQDDGNCGRTNKDPLHRAICRSVAAGVTYIVAAGNDTQDIAKVAPAGYHEVLTATAMADYDGQPGGQWAFAPPCGNLGADDAAATFSNFATLTSDRAHTVAAPGVCIGSTYPHSNYLNSFYGTSFASPLVAGTVALCIASGPCAGLTPAQIVHKIVGDAAAYNSQPQNFGYGFDGDPLRPTPGRYYGFLIRAALY
jgi:subtilisin family serine protease